MSLSFQCVRFSMGGRCNHPQCALSSSTRVRCSSYSTTTLRNGIVGFGALNRIRTYFSGLQGRCIAVNAFRAELCLVSDVGFQPTLFLLPKQVPYQARRIGGWLHNLGSNQGPKD